MSTHSSAISNIDDNGSGNISDLYKSEPPSPNDLQAQNEVSRISCYLAGEIEVPDDVPGWKVLYSPLSAIGIHSEQPRKSKDSGSTHKLCKMPPRAMKRKVGWEGSETKRPIIHTDIAIPLEWEVCVSRLWSHVTHYSLIDSSTKREVFTERIRRIGELASRSLEQRGFFTLKNLLGPHHAVQINQWAWDRWCFQPNLFRPGKVTVGETSSTTIRNDLVTWINPDYPGTPSSTSSGAEIGVPHVQLLFLYIDAVIRALSSRLYNRHGEPVLVNGKSWATLSSHCRHSDSTTGGVGYVAHYDNPDTLCDGRILTALYYLNPRWERSWGGQFVVWPQPPVESSKFGASSNLDRTRPLAILPTLDRFVLFFADQRILHCVQPVLPTSERNERLAIGIWYFDQYEREEYLRAQAV